MKVLIDGDGCPVIAETERAAALYGLEVLIFCDTSHLISSRTSRVILVDQGRDAADWAIISAVKKGGPGGYPGLWTGITCPCQKGLRVSSEWLAVQGRKHRNPSDGTV